MGILIVFFCLPAIFAIGFAVYWLHRLFILLFEKLLNGIAFLIKKISSGIKHLIQSGMLKKIARRCLTIILILAVCTGIGFLFAHGCSNSSKSSTPRKTYSPAIHTAYPDQPGYVYITNTGKRYHRGSCRYLNKSHRLVTYEYAVDHGYTPCQVCNP